jgi:ATP-dependent helicase HrpB
VLPVDEILPDLTDRLLAGRFAVLVAPPGAGKTTRVPPALLDAPWLGEQRIVMLEPRRIAARAAARRIAAERGEPVGRTVGFRVRGESRVSSATRIEVVTEGVLTRMLQEDPSLPGIGAVLFDEFHERSLIADTGLALVLGATSILRDDLRVVVMSATIDAESVAGLMGGAPVLRSGGRLFEVETRHLPPRAGRRLEDHVASVVRDTLEHEAGSQLVFLPGAGEIRRVEALLTGSLPADVDLLPLFGALSPGQQDAAIAISPTGRRKVVLATNVAETSLTIDGIRVVIDAGLERVPRYSPRTGMTRLETVRITRASADQRRGRAGRTAPGIAIRCWSKAEDAGLVPHARAEIVDADLTPLALDLAAAGFADPGELPWLDAPPAAAFQAARELLLGLGALDAVGRLTPHGRSMAGYGAQPRLAHLLLMAAAMGEASLARAAVVVTLLDERDLLRGDGGPPPADLSLRVDAVERQLDHALLAGATIDRGALSRARQTASEWRARLGNPLPDPGSAATVGELLALAFPERVARRRDAPGRFLLRGGRGVRLDPRDALAHAEWLAVAAVDDAGREGRVSLAAPLDDAAVTALIAEQATTSDEVGWDADARAVVARRVQRLGEIVLAEHPLRDVDVEQVQAALLAGIRGLGVTALPWSDAATALRRRLAFLHHHDPSWPDVSDAGLLERLGEWLGPFVSGVRRLEQVDGAVLERGLATLVDWSRRGDLDRLAPERIEVPSGSRIAVAYDDPASPTLAVRLQEVFGLAESPRVMAGAVPVLMQLLSPAQRPVQLTRDLASFWREGYFDVRKDLRGRYPKHHWPDDPVDAEPARGVRRPKR